MMDGLVANEEDKLGIGSLEFKQRHDKIMSECDRLLLHELMMERTEGM